MGRWFGWVTAVVLLAAAMCAMTVAPWLNPWLALVYVATLPVAYLVSFLRARHRGVRMIDAQRRDGYARQRAQDDFLGRLPYPPPVAGPDGGPGTSLVLDRPEPDPCRLER